MVKKKNQSRKLEKKSNSKNSVSSDRILRKHLPQITASELRKLKTDESYKEGFLLAVSLMTSELKTLVYEKKGINNKRSRNRASVSSILDKD